MTVTIEQNTKIVKLYNFDGFYALFVDKNGDTVTVYQQRYCKVVQNFFFQLQCRQGISFQTKSMLYARRPIQLIKLY